MTQESASSQNALPSISSVMAKVQQGYIRSDIPSFRVGDTVKVHAKIREGGKERIQIFEGVVIRRNGGDASIGTFTVRKISYNIGVERVFFVNSPMIERIEVVNAGRVRRARLYYLRDLRGKSARIKSQLVGESDQNSNQNIAEATSSETV